MELGSLSFLVWQHLDPYSLNVYAEEHRSQIDRSWWMQRAMLWYGITSLEYQQIISPAPVLNRNYHREYLYVLSKKRYVERGSEYFFSPRRFLEMASWMIIKTEHWDRLQRDAIVYGLTLEDYSDWRFLRSINLGSISRLVQILDDETLRKLIPISDTQSIFEFGYHMPLKWDVELTDKEWQTYLDGQKVQKYWMEILPPDVDDDIYWVSVYLKNPQIVKGMEPFLSIPSFSYLTNTILFHGRPEDVDVLKMYMERYHITFLLVWKCFTQENLLRLRKNQYVGTIPQWEELINDDCPPLAFQELVPIYLSEEPRKVIQWSLKDSQTEMLEELTEHLKDIQEELDRTTTQENVPWYYYDLVNWKPRLILDRKYPWISSPYRLETYLKSGLEITPNLVRISGEISSQTYPLTYQYLEKLSSVESP